CGDSVCLRRVSDTVHYSCRTNLTLYISNIVDGIFIAKLHFTVAACSPSQASHRSPINKLFTRIRKMAENKGVAPEDTIKINVFAHDQTITMYKMKNNTPLRKLMKSYSESFGLAVAQLRFRFDGRSLCENDTPSSIEMKDGDLIEVYKEQIG
ncbi:small ubiquitin-related modifier 3, partial [Aphis craccivora]